MSPPVIKIKVTPKPVVKGKMDVRFPANITTGNFLTVTRADGTYTFDIDYTKLTPGPISDPATAMIALLDATAGVYREVSLASLLTSGVDADLQAIAALTGAGVLVRTAANTWALRSTVGGFGITVTNGDGVSGNMSIAITEPELVALAGLASAADRLPYFTGSGTAALATFTAFGRTLVSVADATSARSALGAVIGTDVQAYDADLQALANVGALGMWCITGAGTGSVRTITAPAAGITVANGAGTAGNPTLGLANDLAALEGLATTGLARRTGTDAWSLGTAVANSELAAMAAYTIKGNATGSSAVPTDIDITALTAKASPVSADIVLIQDSAASNAFKRTTVGALSSAGSVGSYEGRTGAVVAIPADRINLGAVGVVKVQSFTATGTYTPSAGMVYCVIECWGGGGGGGAVTGSVGTTVAGGGGTAGNYSRLTATAAIIGASKPVTIGAGGASASAGGATSVGSLCVANGGGGGGALVGGSPGAAGTGDISTQNGASGGGGFNSGTALGIAISGVGGSSLVGTGGVSAATGTALTGINANGRAAGGSGGAVNNFAATAPGGAGTAGYIYITEYCVQ